MRSSVDNSNGSSVRSSAGLQSTAAFTADLRAEVVRFGSPLETTAAEAYTSTSLLTQIRLAGDCSKRVKPQTEMDGR